MHEVGRALPKDGRVYIDARRGIQAGEEITYDYRLSIEGRIGKRARAAYACHCGAAKCRGILLVKGAIPGPNGGLVMVRSATKTPLKKGA